ncbi:MULTISPECIES: peptidoglycan DD-metalloendopeptidase family protein [Oceanobacillus]|uniref:Peptidase M24 n=1 Tax=Oceanobacillus kimchii TaxID=746691 RepID=A0ABQ5TLG1_9BACI|nr:MULTISPECIES: peptidoglycan DD-metalloendopeptidase family protein [Oceanobacillus]MBT2600116.1 peptidoglycan DD-metalloendopeptidase family protein [Oceanobacillus sp. ISL-74]MBT2650274.1 peptidoglycan DD-metalloendopeptidase family protein [Oceanobacillus sp. ISL-73]MCT1578017.1 peptidoglycan DD-metalloendopeptidase family protein [Oceanobacillus kimchii]MCT2137577.1 peptidoglycan DD-metalloendopeptidase family protein [Oceanobacillus kimchii]OEH55170.1 hypothetical protein AQ616_08990 [O
MKKITSILVITLLTLTVFGPNLKVSAESADDVQKQIEDLEKEKSNLEKERKNIEDSKKDTESKMEENKQEQNSVESEINNIDSELEDTQKQIETKQTEIDETNDEINSLTEKVEELKERIKELEEEIKLLKERIEKRDELLKNRLLSIQQNGGDIKYLEVIFGASSFGDFISRSTAVNTIMDQDKEIMEEQERDKQALEENKKEVVASKGEIEEKKLAVEDKKKSLEGQHDELLALKDQLNNQIAEKETLMAELVDEHEELEEIKLSAEEEQQLISDEAAAKEQAIKLAQEKKANMQKKEKEKQNTSNQGSNSTASAGGSSSVPSGDFIRPTTGPVTSGFNPNRMHPIFNELRPHTGTDFGASNAGDRNIMASADGVVYQAGVLSGYGNTVMITHHVNGQTFTTLYAHLNSMSVSTGQTVSQGDKIGVMGNTGNSTGVHLHFEIHPGGYKNPVDPFNYIN